LAYGRIGDAASRRAVEQRDRDQVHYAFIINPSKPQAAELRPHIEEFCKRKKLTQVEFIDTQLDKDGRACALEALDHGADVLIAVGGDGTVRTVASVVSRAPNIPWASSPSAPAICSHAIWAFRSMTSTLPLRWPLRMALGRSIWAGFHCSIIRRTSAGMHS
jgi:glycerol dehydrogenase-like iron-containing ADH family enzyme